LSYRALYSSYYKGGHRAASEAVALATAPPALGLVILALGRRPSRLVLSIGARHGDFTVAGRQRSVDDGLRRDLRRV
jgi:hypothetical protein